MHTENGFGLTKIYVIWRKYTKLFKFIIADLESTSIYSETLHFASFKTYY